MDTSGAAPKLIKGAESSLLWDQPIDPSKIGQPQFKFALPDERLIHACCLEFCAGDDIRDIISTKASERMIPVHIKFLKPDELKTEIEANKGDDDVDAEDDNVDIETKSVSASPALGSSPAPTVDMNDDESKKSSSSKKKTKKQIEKERKLKRAEAKRLKDDEKKSRTLAAWAAARSAGTGAGAGAGILFSSHHITVDATTNSALASAFSKTLPNNDGDETMGETQQQSQSQSKQPSGSQEYE